MVMSDAMRAAAIAAVLLAGSCAAPVNNGMGLTDDPDMNHPIVLDTAPKSVCFSRARPFPPSRSCRMIANDYCRARS